MNVTVKLGYETYLLTVPEAVLGIVSSALLTAQEVIDPYEAIPTIRPLATMAEVKVLKEVKYEGSEEVQDD